MDELPDVGDPFDVAEARRPIMISDEDNAYVAYAAAHIKSQDAPTAFWDGLWKGKDGALTWSKAEPGVLDFLKKNRAALEIWRAGSERPDSFYHQRSQQAFDITLPLMQEVALHSGMAALEGSRLEEKGEIEEAWRWYRAMLRSSRLIGRHGVLVERRYGAKMHELAARRILHWAADPRVDTKHLHQALKDTLAADALTSPDSEAVKLEYLMCLRDLDELLFSVREIAMPRGRAGWLNQVVPWSVGREIHRFRLRAANDVERSRRALRLVFANWLAQVNRPAAERAPIAILKPTLIYAADPTAPPAARAVKPELLDRAIDHTSLARIMLRSEDAGNAADRFWWWEREGFLARERRRRSAIIVKLAAELYRREHGQLPPTAGALLGPYLEVLPEGVKSDDPIPSQLE
ncbi:MAG: hypothetical protein ACHRXM_15300 [Isosphaerales bacterium]